MKSGLPNEFRTKMVSTIAYLWNHGVSIAIDFGLSEEDWSGKADSLFHLWVFGSTCYIDAILEDSLILVSKSKKYTFFLCH